MIDGGLGSLPNSRVSLRCASPPKREAAKRRQLMDPEKLKAQFTDYLRSGLGRRPGTVKQYLWRLDYIEHLLDKAVQDITPTDLRAFKRDTTLGRETLKGIIVALKQFHSWGVLEGLWPDSGLRLVRTPRIQRLHVHGAAR
jgi:hypothetical protein